MLANLLQYQITFSLYDISGLPFKYGTNYFQIIYKCLSLDSSHFLQKNKKYVQ